MANLIAYHHKTTDLALFLSESGYWIGSYFPQASHQTGEPAYCLISGYFESEAEAMSELSKMTGDEV